MSPFYDKYFMMGVVTLTNKCGELVTPEWGMETHNNTGCSTQNIGIFGSVHLHISGKRQIVYPVMSLPNLDVKVWSPVQCDPFRIFDTGFSSSVA